MYTGIIVAALLAGAGLFLGLSLITYQLGYIGDIDKRLKEIEENTNANKRMTDR